MFSTFRALFLCTLSLVFPSFFLNQLVWPQRFYCLASFVQERPIDIIALLGPYSGHGCCLHRVASSSSETHIHYFTSHRSVFTIAASSSYPVRRLLNMFLSSVWCLLELLLSPVHFECTSQEGRPRPSRQGCLLGNMNRLLGANAQANLCH